MDTQLICAILRSVSEHLKEQPDSRNVPFPRFDGYPPEAVDRHIVLCDEAGYLKVGMADGGPIRIRSMTISGYRALENLRCGKYDRIFDPQPEVA